jgi:hypothetical protein
VRLAAKLGRPVAEVRAELEQYDQRVQALCAQYGNGPGSLERIVVTLAAEYGVDPGELRRQAEQLAEEAEQRGECYW